MSQQEQEVILAQEQSAICKTDGKQYQGTLILTNKRLMFVKAIQEEEIDSQERGLSRRRLVDLRYANIDDLQYIPTDPGNLSVALQAIEFEKGHSGLIALPSLQIVWKDGQRERKSEFVQEIIDRTRKRGLKDWADVIEKLRSGSVQLQMPGSPTPSKDTLEGKILYTMGDMQDKGVLEIEQEVESNYSLDLDPDDVEAACKSLVSSGFLDKMSDPSGESFFRKRSPLGKDDLSS